MQLQPRVGQDIGGLVGGKEPDKEYPGQIDRADASSAARSRLRSTASAGREAIGVNGVRRDGETICREGLRGGSSPQAAD